VRTLVRHQLLAALDALRADGWSVPEGVDVPLDKPKRPEHGDLATNVAMLLTRATGRKPREIAEALVAKLTPALGCEDSPLAALEIAGPGFLNFRLRDTAFHAVIEQVFAEGPEYGRARDHRPGRVLVEYVSANPTGPLHLGHARGVVVGDALVRVMRAAGYDVTTEYYVNDAGQKVVNFAWTLRLVAHGQPLWLEAYRGDYVKPLAEEIRAEQPELLADPQPMRAATEEELARELAAIRREKGREPTDEERALAAVRPLPHPQDRALAAAGVARMMAHIRATLARCGVLFDQYISETSFVESGAVQALIDEWKARGLVVEREGALFFKVSETSEADKDRVLRKSTGDFTYFATDIAYHRDKLARGFDHLIDVWGADHHGYIPRMRAALEALGLPKSAFEVLLMQMVSLVKDGQPYRMSKSAGTFITIDEILDEIDAGAGHEGAGRDALRYFLLSRSSDSPMEIDIGLAKKQSVDNPVFYAQYSHARMHQILERALTAPEFEDARARGLLTVPACFDAKLAARLALSEEKELLAMCDLFPQVVREAAEHRAPHRVLFFVQEVAQAFASYYTRLQKVHNDAVLPQKSFRESGPDWLERWDWEKTCARLMWVAAIKQVYANALTLVGIEAPERMGRLAAVDEAGAGDEAVS
jgi:arginyl-tRNA synthetase